MHSFYGVILEGIADDLSVCYCYKKRSQEPVVDAIIDKLSYQKITLLEILLRFWTILLSYKPVCYWEVKISKKEIIALCKF